MVNRWGKNGNSDRLFFFFLGSKITEDSDCCHEIKRRLLLGRKAMTSQDSVLKSRDIAVSKKAHTVNIEIWRTDVLELLCWRRLLRVPWTAKRPNQSILKEINPEYSLEELILKLKLQYFGWLFGKDPDAGKDWRQEKKGVTENEMVGWNHWLNGHEFEQTLGDGEGQGSLECCGPWGRKE